MRTPQEIINWCDTMIKIHPNTENLNFFNSIKESMEELEKYKLNFGEFKEVKQCCLDCMWFNKNISDGVWIGGDCEKENQIITSAVDDGNDCKSYSSHSGKSIWNILTEEEKQNAKKFINQIADEFNRRYDFDKEFVEQEKEEMKQRLCRIDHRRKEEFGPMFAYINK